MNFNEFLDAIIIKMKNNNSIKEIFELAVKNHQKSNFEKAEKFYKELIYLEEENAAHYRGVARALIQQGKQAEAQRYFDKSKKYD